MSASPAASTVTTPPELTVTAAAFEVCHVAWAVTFCAVPFPRVAVAVNRDVAPIAGADPLTVSAETVPPALLVDVEEGAAGPDGDPLKRTTLSDASTTTLRRDRDVTVRTYGLWLACPH